MNKDLLYHFLAGAIIALFSIRLNTDAMVVCGISAATLAGTGKELYDKYIKRTTFDVADLCLTIVGGMTAVFIIAFLRLIK